MDSDPGISVLFCPLHPDFQAIPLQSTDEGADNVGKKHLASLVYSYGLNGRGEFL